MVAVGDASYIDGSLTPSGRYVLLNDWGIIIRDGIIQSVFWPKPYILKTGQQIIVDCREKNTIAPNQSDRAFWLSGLPIEDGKYYIEKIGKVRIRGGCIDGFPLF